MIRTRFAPSPTGFLHIGGLRTALFSYLYAKKHDGVFLLRVEDTDRERFVEGGMENILQSLAWAHIIPDEGVLLGDAGVAQAGENGPYIQSERLPLYKKYVQILLDTGNAYYAFDTVESLESMRQTQQAQKLPTKYDRMAMNNQCTLGEAETKRRIESGDPYVIRLRMPAGETISFNDLIRGNVSFHSDEVDDQVLMKSDGFPTYHLAVVIDDHLMGITHVIRGEEWLSSTPKHVQLYRAFGWQAPEFAHVPLMVNKERQKLSKRHGHVSVEDYRERGYLPEALVNFIAFCGWNPGDDREIFSLSQLIQEFDLRRVSKSAAVFNVEKLDWYNKQYMMSMDVSDLALRAMPFFVNAGILRAADALVPAHQKHIADVIALERGRASTLLELVESTRFFWADDLVYEPDILIWKKSTREKTREILDGLSQIISSLSEEKWTKETIESEIMGWIGEKGYGNGDVLWPLRVALSGQKNSPGPFDIASILQKEKTLSRLKKAAEHLA